MYEHRCHQIDARIVSITQPHVRPIVRGKAGRAVEFGAKLSASCAYGCVFLDHLGWDNFNESGDLVSQVEQFKRRFGHYPESVHVDQIYRTRANRAWCRERGIRISGPQGADHRSMETQRPKNRLSKMRGFAMPLKGNSDRASDASVLLASWPSWRIPLKPPLPSPSWCSILSCCRGSFFCFFFGSVRDGYTTLTLFWTGAGSHK